MKRPTAAIFCLLLLCLLHPQVTRATADPLLDHYQRARQLAAAGDYPAALKSAQQALELAEAELHDNDPHLAPLLNEVAALQYRLGRYQDAARLFERSLRLKQRVYPEADPQISLALNNLASVYRALQRLTEAEQLQREALQIDEQARGQWHPSVAEDLNNLALILQQQGKFEASQTFLQRALSIFQASGRSDGRQLAGLYSNLALVYKLQGRFRQALNYYQLAHKQAESSYPAGHPAAIRITANLASLFKETGADRQAEKLYRQLFLAIRTQHNLPPRDTAFVLNGYASLLAGQGRDAPAGVLYREVLKTDGAELAAEPLLQGVLYNNLGQLALQESHFGQAETDLLKARECFQRLGAEKILWLPTVLNNLALVQDRQGEPVAAEATLREALQIAAQAFGPASYQTSQLLANLASLLKQRGALQQADDALARAFALAAQNLPADHPQLAELLNSRAAVQIGRGQLAQADEYSAQATQIVLQRLRLSQSAEARARQRHILLNRIALLARRAENEPEQRERFSRAAFILAQWADTSRAGEAMQQLAARFGRGQGRLSAVIRERQDALSRLQNLETLLNQELLMPGSPADSLQVGEVQRQYKAAQRDLNELTVRLTREFPEYLNLEMPTVVAGAEVQKLLGPTEGLLLVLTGETESYLWLIRADRLRLRRVNLGRQELAKRVTILRRGLEQSDVVFADELRPFDLSLSHQLYLDLLQPFESSISQLSKLLTVVDGDLLSLPFSLLVKSSIAAGGGRPDYRAVDWLIKTLALERLPTVSGLLQLRAEIPPSAATRNFVGFGDPVLTDYWGGTVALRGSGREKVVADDIKRLPRLPETARELKTIAGILSASPADLYLGPAASEAQLATVALRDYRIISFASHALVAGDLPGLSEPALVLTPPRETNQKYDGLLTASEVAALKLDAELVILSACNTAAADGRARGESLSGLARAFLYAGSRNLLVSYWPVNSAATSVLMTEFFRYWRQQGMQQKSLALAKAMRQVLSREDMAHPLFWAPFMLIGAETRR